jgi:hypothetical protein
MPQSFIRHQDVPMAYDLTLERRIRELCAQAVATPNTAELGPILAELRVALRQHVAQIKSLVAEFPFEIGKPAA